MSARRALAAFAALALLATAGASASRNAPARVRHVYAAQFPPGPGKAIAERACVACHSPMLVVQQAKDSTAWEKTIGQMAKWGVELTPVEHDTLRAYLVSRLGPRGR